MSLARVSGIYRREGTWNLIELKLNEPAQLFNSFDPSPFHERDLDADAAEYLINAFRELHGHKHVKLVVYLAETQPETTTFIQSSIGNYFRYREMVTRFQVKQRLRLGRSSLVVGLLFLFVCSFIRLWLPTEDMAMRTINEGLLIIGWVAMWKPLEILLYEWWPLLADSRLYGRLSEIPVEVKKSDLPRVNIEATNK
jgi:hypothetical protein